MTSPQLIIRVRSPDLGTHRIECSSSDSISTFIAKVKDIFKLSGSSWWLSKTPDGKTRLILSASRLSSVLKNGDMVFLCGGIQLIPTVNGANPTASLDSTVSSVQEDTVDLLLATRDGKIPRKRNPFLCHHSDQNKCIHCSPYEPFDEEYLKSIDPPVKYLSFHSYLKKLRSGADKGKFVSLEDVSCRIRPGCTTHPAWPEGICTQCQPSSVVLQLQRYRHVDYVQFDNSDIIDRFLNFWRKTGSQRFGFLIGKYTPHENVPLGIAVRVVAIYEPPQLNSPDSFELLELSLEAQARAIHNAPGVRLDGKPPTASASTSALASASASTVSKSAHDCEERLRALRADEQRLDALLETLGLTRVGCIFTDLVVDKNVPGGVKHFRGTPSSYYLSGEECLLAAMLQNRYPNRCRYSPTGVFGSKFVTVVVTGDVTHQIHSEAYQVSNQGMALVRDDCLVPTDAPELLYVRNSSAEQYIPDVFYKRKDEYGNEVQREARPLPIEYLLVDMACGMPLDPEYTLCSRSPVHLAIENRAPSMPAQDVHAFSQYLHASLPALFSAPASVSPLQILQVLSDLHVLLFLASNDFIPFEGDELQALLKAVATGNEREAERVFHGGSWQTLLRAIEAAAILPSPSPRAADPASNVPNRGRSAAGQTAGSMWSCSFCTFLNPATRSQCEICNHQRNAN